MIDPERQKIIHLAKQFADANPQVFGNIDQMIDNAYEAGIAEGLRRATESLKKDGESNER